MDKVSYISTGEKLLAIRQDTTCSLCTDVLHSSSEVNSSSDVVHSSFEVHSSSDVVHSSSEVHSSSDVVHRSSEVNSSSDVVHSSFEVHSSSDVLHSSCDVDSSSAVDIANIDMLQSYDMVSKLRSYDINATSMDGSGSSLLCSANSDVNHCGELHAFCIHCSSDVDFPTEVFLANTRTHTFSMYDNW